MKAFILPQDVHTDEEGRILVDEQNDCLNFDFAREGEDILFFYTRKFDTCDSGDYVIEVSRQFFRYQY